jgi:flagellar biosynthetic protein FliR
MIELPPIVRLALLLVRPGFLFLAAPLFGGAYAPPVLKIGLTLVLGISMIPLVPLPDALPPPALALVLLREALIGLSLGFAIRVLVAGAEFGGHLAGFQLGFTYASVVDPQSGVRNGVLSALYGTVAIVVFFAVNAHHDLLRALARSFEALPVGAGQVGDGLASIVMRLLGLVFVLGAQLAAPVVIVLLVAELALGLLSRAAPTLNLMAQGFPIRLLVGLLALAAMVHVLPGAIARGVPRAIEIGVRAATLFR